MTVPMRKVSLEQRVNKVKPKALLSNYALTLPTTTLQTRRIVSQSPHNVGVDLSETPA